MNNDREIEPPAPQSTESPGSFSLTALRDGDRVEFARLVETYSPLIYRLGLKMLVTPQNAEDMLQETFIKAYRHLDSFDGRASISTWLYRIATNEALMVLRESSRIQSRLNNQMKRIMSFRYLSRSQIGVVFLKMNCCLRRDGFIWTKRLPTCPPVCGLYLSYETWMGFQPARQPRH